MRQVCTRNLAHIQLGVNSQVFATDAGPYRPTILPACKHNIVNSSSTFPT